MIYLKSAAWLDETHEKHRQIISKRFVIRESRGKELMKKFVRPFITLSLGLALAILSAALTYIAPPVAQGNLAAAAFFIQPTKTPPPKDLSVIGSTDGIVAMGFVIALIIVIPILLQRKSWMENR